MQWFRNLRTRNKLSIGFGLVVLVIVGSQGVLFMRARAVQEGSETLRLTVVPATQISAGMKLAVVQVQQWLTDVSASGDTDGLREVEKWANEFRDQAAALRKLGEKAGFRIEEVELDRQGV